MIIHFKTPTGRTEKVNTQNKRFKIKELEKHFEIKEKGQFSKNIFNYNINKKDIIKIEI